jgi:hypothetical protein
VTGGWGGPEVPTGKAGRWKHVETETGSPLPLALAAPAPLTTPSSVSSPLFWPSPPPLDAQLSTNLEFKEEYGSISKVPDHDGTDCFKWDQTLWSHEAHFKVGGRTEGGGGGKEGREGEREERKREERRGEGREGGFSRILLASPETHPQNPRLFRPAVPVAAVQGHPEGD